MIRETYQVSWLEVWGKRLRIYCSFIPNDPQKYHHVYMILELLVLLNGEKSTIIFGRSLICHFQFRAAKVAMNVNKHLSNSEWEWSNALHDIPFWCVEVSSNMILATHLSLMIMMASLQMILQSISSNRQSLKFHHQFLLSQANEYQSTTALSHP